MAESPDGMTLPDGTRVHITYVGVTAPGVMASNLVVKASFNEDPGRAMLGGDASDRKLRAVESIMNGESVSDWEANELEIDRAARAALDYTEPNGHDPIDQASWMGWFGEKREGARE